MLDNVHKLNINGCEFINTTYSTINEFDEFVYDWKEYILEHEFKE